MAFGFSSRTWLSSNRNTTAAAEASQKLMFGSILKIKPAKKVALAQPSDPHMRARPNSKPLMRLTRSV